MKKIKFYLWALWMVFVAVSFVACSDDDHPGPEPEPTPEPGVYHFDLWVTVGENSGGMGNKDDILVKTNLTDLSEGNLNFTNNGVDVTAKLYQESIIKGKYYYQIPKSEDRFGEYQLIDDEVVTNWEFEFFTFEGRKYSHCWTDDNTIVLFGANGDQDAILWAKINIATRTAEEGMLDLSRYPEALLKDPAKERYNTSGIAAYRESDGLILYSFVFASTSSMGKAPRGEFYMAFIDPSDMSVKTLVTEDRADIMAGTAFGELLQQKSFFAENGDYYLGANIYVDTQWSTGSTSQKGALFRVKDKQTQFDSSYNGYEYDGKIVSMNNLGNGKALLYIQDPAHTGASGWGGTFNCYYSILDLATGVKTDMDLPFSQGTFSQFAVVQDDTAYIGVYPSAEEDTAVWLYDIPSGTLTKGMTITKGYVLDRIVVVED